MECIFFNQAPLCQSTPTSQIRVGKHEAPALVIVCLSPLQKRLEFAQLQDLLLKYKQKHYKQDYRGSFVEYLVE